MKTETILLIGRGGREHALAWKLAQSPRVRRVWVAPGNGGTALAGGKVANVALAEGDFAGLIDFTQRNGVTLTVVGPEAPLAEGIVDAFQTAGLRCFGPSRAAAQIEASKAFAKDFMARHGIPTARYAAFSDFSAALAHLRQVDYPVVLKASGLAAGKGVILPASLAEGEAALRQIMVSREFGAAGDQVVIEERLAGPEASVLAFSDGRTAAIMPTAQDHKRVFDDDQGPNTGGMGAYAPAPLLTPALLEQVRRTVLQPAIDGLAAEGAPYVGVLYAGLMLTGSRDGADGFRYAADGYSTRGNGSLVTVLEFNCRFGDPETQVILPLLASDLVEVIEACLDGVLAQLDLRWSPGAAATVVAASEGYPGNYPKGRQITGVAAAETLPDVAVFHAGTRLADDGRLLTDGGRVLSVTGVGADLPAALARAYTGIQRIHFPGMHFRRDIGARASGG
ncbi:MAG: phosphoribosylamine--glycine ligase [Anaerolinea sp.]|nr:phosphoribosylamine--glycine ligase [Anaerolinea sp.]